LGVEYIKTPIEKKHNTGDYKDTMSEEMRKKLKLIFKPYNAKLQKLLGRDFF
jgi:N-formylglutamate amidohydrolase